MGLDNNPLARMLVAEQAQRGKIATKSDGEFFAVGPVKDGVFTEEFQTRDKQLADTFAEARIAGVSVEKARVRVEDIGRGKRVPSLGLNPLHPAADDFLVRQAMAEAPIFERMLRESGISESELHAAREAAAEGSLKAKLVIFLFDEGGVPLREAA